MWWTVLIVVGLAVASGAALAFSSYHQARREAESAMSALAARAKVPTARFAPEMVSDLPEIAQRYFTHAIAPGTPLHTTVQLEMRGTFLLGAAAKMRPYSMTAREVLAPPEAFVWMASMGSGLMQISGSDGLIAGRGWTQFWINGLAPVVNVQTTPDLVRSALSRAAMEAIWAPASLLPSHGVGWMQTGPDTGRVTFATGIEPVDITLASDGRVLSVSTMRWSDANTDKTFRLQPFGGTIEAEARFAGFTIPSVVRMGNHFGTKDYLAFFQAEITAADYL